MKKSIFLSLIFVLVLATGCGNKSQTLVCTKNLSDSTIKMEQKTNIKFENDKVEDMAITISVKLPDSYKSYANTFKESIQNEYENKYGQYKSIKLETVTKSDTEIDVNMDIDYKNMSSSDKKALNLAGSEKYSVNKKALEDQGFTCK